MRHVYQDQTIGGADILNSLADVNIGNPEDGQMLVYDASTQRWRNVTQKSLNDLAEVTDLTNVIATGPTNATGNTITSGLYFYLDGVLCKAKSDIANGATFTLNTNYEVVTAGGLNSLNSALEWKFVGEAFGNVNISLPAGWRELAVVARYGTSSGLQSQTVPFRLTRMSKGLASVGGAGTIASQVFINNDATTISLIHFAVSDTAYTATSKIYVSYR